MKLTNGHQRAHIRIGQSDRSRLGAILSMELVLVLPIFMVLLFAVVEFSLLASARNRMSDAARCGVRELCINDESPDLIRQELTKRLGPKLSQGIVIDVRAAARAGEVANVRVTVPMKNATPDLLWLTGFSVQNRFLTAEAPMVREHDNLQTGLQRL
ncbi:MAG: pilus assembly protein [Planctomycetaceae bacterium]